MNKIASPTGDQFFDKNQVQKLIIVPSYTNSLGGMTVSLLLLVKGFWDLGAADRLKVAVRSGSLMEKCFQEAGYADVLHIISPPPKKFFEYALDWVREQPKDWILLLDNCVWRDRLPTLLKASWSLRWSDRTIYHFSHDLALSNNPLGFLLRKITFACLDPKVICNSEFTANHVRQIMPNIQGILYQPVDLDKYKQRLSDNFPPPENLRSILDSGARIMLTPSRINEPGIVNDKNLRALLPVLAALKAKGYFYHGIVIGEDSSSGKKYTQALLKQAQDLGIADRFTVLPATFHIEDYYKYADVVVTLAPREPFGRTVVEAITCGVPVVGSNSGGINEILKNFAPDWVTNPNNPEFVADKIIDVLEGSETPTTLAKGQNWVDANCSVNSYATGMMKLTGLFP